MFYETFWPFSSDKSLRCISTGVEAPVSVNVDQMDTVGEVILQGMLNQDVDTYTFPVTMKAKTLAFRPDLIIKGQVE